MQGPGRAAFGLHLDHPYGLTENIQFTLRRPGVDQLGHHLDDVARGTELAILASGGDFGQ